MSKISGVRLLRITLLTGLILLVLALCVLTGFFLIERSATSITRRQDSFHRILREYDEAAAVIFGTGREFEHLHRELDKLEKRAVSVESWLSILKRRRALSAIHPPSLENYRASIQKALEIYPFSQPITALSAAALIKDSGISLETEDRLRGLLSSITDFSFNNLRLSFHVILGDLKNPGRAAIFPGDIYSDGTEAVMVDLAILKILRGDYRGAAAEIQPALYSPSPSPNALRFAAEYNYDFGDLLRSAEIFSLLDDDEAMIRQADALYLAGYPDSARTIWNMLADTEGETYSQNETALYNLAVTSSDDEDAARFLEKLVNIETVSNADSRQFGLILYSRLLEDTQALTALQKNAFISPADYPFIDLEVCKRLSRGRDTGKQAAEAWLLLDRHPENEDLYRWAAWQLFFQRSYNEAGILLDRMDLLQFTAQWTRFYRAVQLMSEGNIEAAENLLLSFSPEDADYAVYANLGRIMESRSSARRAVEMYELAAANAQDPKIAARIQLRLARCFSALNRPLEARLALVRAVEIDPENLTARLELERWGRERR